MIEKRPKTANTGIVGTVESCEMDDKNNICITIKREREDGESEYLTLKNDLYEKARALKGKKVRTLIWGNKGMNETFCDLEEDEEN